MCLKVIKFYSVPSSTNMSSFFPYTPFRKSYIQHSIAQSLRKHEINDEEDSSIMEEEEEGPRHIDDDAIPYIFSTSTIPSGYTSPYSSEEEEEDVDEIHSLLEEEEEEKSIRLEILADNVQKEEDRYAILSRAPNVLINIQVDSQYRNGDPEWTPWSRNIWEILESLALPTSAAFLALFVRHCMYVCGLWIQHMLESIQSDSLIVPEDFEELILPRVQTILFRVQHRRWICSITKKYHDGICSDCLCPPFRYARQIEHKGYMILFPQSRNRIYGDPYRKVKQEVNMTRSMGNNPYGMVPLLWALEFQLNTLCHLNRSWLKDKRTSMSFSKLRDSRTLFSVHEPELCDIPIMEYDIKNLRDAIGRLHWRWNDMRPTYDLFDYFMLLKDRCAIISIFAKVEHVCIDTSISCTPSSYSTTTTKKGVRNAVSSNKNSVICPNTAFSYFLGRNRQDGVMKLTSDLIVSSKERKKTNISGMSEYLKKRQSLNDRVTREVKSIGMGFSALHDTSTRPLEEDNQNVEWTCDGKKAYGDTESQPMMVRLSLNRGSNMLDYSSGSEDGDEVDKEKKNKKKENTNDNFFDSRTKKDASIYKDFGRDITDHELAEEILCRSIMSKISTEGLEDVPGFLKSIFFPCLSTTVEVNKSLDTPTMFHATMVTSTNRSFLVETHAMLCEMDEEIRAWNTMRFLSSEEWPSTNGNEWRDPEDPSRFVTSSMTVNSLPRYISESVDEKIAFEKCKIQSALSWAYDFCNGKRNQFISRNIRELFFTQYLLPGEAEIMLNVNHLKHSSIVPSIIVSRLRNDVERLDKLIYDFTLYNTMEEFARENGLSIRDGNQGSVKFAKHIHGREEEEEREKEDDVSLPRAPSLIQSFHRAMDMFRECSLRDILESHDIDGRDERRMLREEEKEEEKDYDIFHPSQKYLSYLSQYAPSMTYLNPSVSISWKSPRGIVQVVRVILLQCMEFFMKEIHHTLEAKRFFFTKRMTLRLMNDPMFMEALDEREMEEEEGEEEEGSDIPSRRDLYQLLNPTDPIPPPLEEIDVSSNVHLYASFRFFMQNRFEIHCQRFYHCFPITLYCMTTSFIFWPRECVARECTGADSLMGYYSWIDASVTYISQHMIPHLLTNFYLTVYDERQFFASMSHVLWNVRRSTDMMERMKRLERAYREKFTRFSQSGYKDGGMHYRFLLMLLSKMPKFGGKDKYSVMCSYACTAVIRLARLMYPDILERNFIHIPPPNFAAPETTVEDDEEGEEEEEMERMPPPSSSIFVHRPVGFDM